jgi:hypothetical protein
MESNEGDIPTGESLELPMTVDAVIERLKDLRRQRDVIEYPETREEELRQGEKEIVQVIERLVHGGKLSSKEKKELDIEILRFTYNADPDEIPASRRLRELETDLQESMEPGRSDPPHQ